MNFIGLLLFFLIHPFRVCFIIYYFTNKWRFVLCSIHQWQQIKLFLYVLNNERLVIIIDNRSYYIIKLN